MILLGKVLVILGKWLRCFREVVALKLRLHRFKRKVFPVTIFSGHRPVDNRTSHNHEPSFGRGYRWSRNLSSSAKIVHISFRTGRSYAGSKLLLGKPLNPFRSNFALDLNPF